MYKYLDENVFKEIKDSFVLVERDTPYEKGRLGLMMAVDLEEYDYTPFAPVAIRAKTAKSWNFCTTQTLI